MRATQTYVATHGGTSADEPPRTGRSALRRLYQYARPYRAGLALAIVSIVGAACLQMLLVYQSKAILDVDPAEGTPGAFASRLLTASLGILGVGALLALFSFGQLFFSNSVALKTVRDLRADMFRHLHSLELSYYDRARSGELMSRLVNDTYILQTALSVDFPSILAAPVAVAVGLGVMLSLSWRVTLVALVAVPTIGLMVGLLGKRLKRIVHAMQSKVGDLQSVLQESLAGIRIVKCFGMEDAEGRRFRQHNQQLYHEGLRAARVSAILKPMGHYVGVIGFVGVLGVGMHEISASRLDLSGLLVLAVLVQRVAASLNHAGNGVAMVNQAAAICERSFELLDTRAEIVDADAAVDLEVGDGHVVFEAVSFSYDGGGEVLSDVSFEIPPGKRVALVGASGSGKSTVANLVPRLYEPTAGRILINGQDIARVKLASLRRHIGVVLQDMFLFSGSVRSNILVGAPGATEEQVIAAAQAANAHEFIERLPDGYDTEVGERGVTLSSGQRQRVAIARALLRDPKVLVLDEATSALDSESEAVVQAALEVLMRDRTSLVIAHRLSTIRSADQILVLSSGRIIERGTHLELMAANGAYAALWRMQATAPESQADREAV